MSITIVLISIIFFCAMIFNLAANPKLTRKLIGVFIFVSAAGGLVLYGIGFSCTEGSPVTMILRTVFDVCKMFAGQNDYAAVSSAPIFGSKAVQDLFWVFHLMAFYATASATISAIGARALKKLKFWLQRYGKSTIIYGINEQSVGFGRELISNGEKNIVFIDSSYNKSLESSLNEIGALVRTDDSALHPDRSFLKSLGSEKGAPSLSLYAMESDSNLNYNYAKNLLSALEKQKVSCENTTAVLRSFNDSTMSDLASSDGHFGFGDVRMFSDVSIASRMLILSVPPYEKMTFSSTGVAADDFDAVIIGFGKTGQSVLRQLVANAQFEGSTFHAAVFSPKYDREAGYYFSCYSAMMSNYDISFHAKDAGSIEFYDYLRDHAGTLKYLVICTGSKETDSEIWDSVISYFRTIHCDAAVCQCSSSALIWAESADSCVMRRDVYTYDAIVSDKLDKKAKILNYSYVDDKSVTLEQSWKNCDYFGRESSRASADFSDVFLKMSGVSKDDVSYELWSSLSDELLMNMAKTEHLRWCAFHYSMGFSPMDDETVSERGNIYRQEILSNGKADIRICKDLAGRKHACLRPWDDLDSLSELEKKYTGVYTDYKDTDLRNVRSLPMLIKAGD